MVESGGRILYSTCSSEPEENENVVDAFLANHTDFDPVGLDSLRSLPLQGLRDTLDDHGRLSTAPDTHGLEAFFAAVLRRRD